MESLSKKKPIILVCLGHYLPGYKSGGPLRSVVNLLEHLHEDFDFCIFTTDRDLGDEMPYSSIKSNAWNTVGAARVYYASPDKITLSNLASLIRETPHDILYLNSFFSPKFSILPLLARRLGLTLKRPVVLAPRGEFSTGAVALKAWKKRPFLGIAKAIGLYDDVWWQASSEFEVKDIRKAMGARGQGVHVACNLPTPLVPAGAGPVDGGSDVLKIVFLSRVSPKKNLMFALAVIEHVRVPVEFYIYGPAEDASYWSQCQAKMEHMPEHVTVQYKGSIEPTEVPRVMATHDIFFLPTLGENYGHVIAEAIGAGTSVLISDQTPWRGLAQKGLGRDFPLGDVLPYVEFIETMAQLDKKEKSRLRSGVLAYAQEMQRNNEDVERNRALFCAALETSSA